MTKTLFLDIETLPAQSQAAQERILSNLKAPGNYKKPEAIEAWMAENTPDAIAKSSLNGAYGNICTIGFAFDDEHVSTVSWPLQHETEKEALRYFAQFIDTANSTPVIVGHNVIDFDLRFIWQRAFVLGVKMPSYFPVSPKPWSNEVFDTMKIWAGAKGYVRLDEIAFAMGIDGKTGDGSMVAQMWNDGEYEHINSYCRDDVELTRQIYKRMKMAMG